MPFFPPSAVGGASLKMYADVAEANAVTTEEYAFLNLSSVTSLIPNAVGGGTIYFWSYLSNYGSGPMPPDPASYGVCVQTAIITDGSYETSWRRIRVWDGDEWSPFYAWERTDLEFNGYLSKTNNYVLDHADHHQSVGFVGGSARTLTLPNNTTTPLSYGFESDVYRMGAGTVTIVPAAGVTLRNAFAVATIRAQYGKVHVHKIGANEWVLSGDVG